jgi:hypothetical protein
MSRIDNAALRRRDMIVPIVGLAAGALVSTTGASAQEQPPGSGRRPTPPAGTAPPPGAPPAKKPPERRDDTALIARRRGRLAGALNDLRSAKTYLADASVIPSRRVNAHIDAAIAELQIAFNKTA